MRWVSGRIASDFDFFLSLAERFSCRTSLPPNAAERLFRQPPAALRTDARDIAGQIVPAAAANGISHEFGARREFAAACGTSPAELKPSPLFDTVREPAGQQQCGVDEKKQNRQKIEQPARRVAGSP
jgi:hypothetical protein